MEQRALTILFVGNKPSDETILKIQNVLSKGTFSHPEDVKIFACTEENLAKMMAKEIMKQHSCPISEEDVTVTEAVKTLAKEYPFSDDTAFVIHFGRNIPEIYGRVKYGKAIQHDVNVIKNIKIILNNNILGTIAIKNNGGTDNTINIIRKIFNNYFDEKGNAR